MDHHLYGLLNLKSNEIIKSRNVKFFENPIMNDKKYEIQTNKKSREEGSPRIVETQSELMINKRTRKAKDLEPNKIDYRLISFI